MVSSSSSPASRDNAEAAEAKPDKVAGGLIAFAAVIAWRPQRSLEADHALKEGTADRFWRSLAVQDWIAFFYLFALLGCTIAGTGPRRTTALVCIALDLAAFVIALGLTRSEVVRGNLKAAVYRVGIFVAVFGSFCHLQYILPTARSSTVDDVLYALDRNIFGLEPAELFDRWVTPATTEWFSFFYFGYFFILAIHIFPFLLWSKNEALVSELSLGVVALFCTAHLLYICVPGHGPYHHLAKNFEHTLDGPTWWPLVKLTVDSVEVTARTDIFPSLHTAAPVYLALFSMRHRNRMPFRFTWIPLSLFASQIVISTMFLRWHYLIDVLAGLLLATLVSRFAARTSSWEMQRRQILGKSPIWTFFRSR